MFCGKCGAPMPDGSGFCPACGAAVPAGAESSGGASRVDDLAGQTALPEGIVMDETGVLHWEYVQNMWTNPVHLYLLLKIFFIVGTCVLAIICTMGGIFGDFSISDMVFACAFIYGICLVLCLLGVAFVNLLHGGRNYYEFVMGAEGNGIKLSLFVSWSPDATSRHTASCSFLRRDGWMMASTYLRDIRS